MYSKIKKDDSTVHIYEYGQSEYYTQITKIGNA
jgi:hypothetical protein